MCPPRGCAAGRLFIQGAGRQRPAPWMKEYKGAALGGRVPRPRGAPARAPAGALKAPAKEPPLAAEQNLNRVRGNHPAQTELKQALKINMDADSIAPLENGCLWGWWKTGCG